MEAGHEACVSLIQHIAWVDVEFAMANYEHLAHGIEYPHFLMEEFAHHLATLFGVDSSKCARILTAVIPLIEDALSYPAEQVQNLVEVSFLEPIHYENRPLLQHLLTYSESRLRYEILAFETTELGYRIAMAVRDVYGETPPEHLSDMLQSPVFLEALSFRSIHPGNGSLVDAWGNPYRVEMRTDPRDQKKFFCVISAASLRGRGSDIETCVRLDVA